MKKKIFMFLFCVITAVASLAAINAVDAEAMTDGYYTYTVSNNEATITYVDASISGEISVPSSLDGYSVVAIEDKSFSYCSDLTNITIPDGITRIGKEAFLSCSSLTSITIPDSVTTIGDRAFYNCKELTCVNISDIASWCKIKFISYFDHSSNPLVYGGKLYLNGNIVTDLIIPDGVNTISDYAFSSCSSITSVTIPGSVWEIGNDAFYDCASLTNVTIHGSAITIGDGAFRVCTSLESISVDDKNLYYCSVDGVLFSKNMKTLIQYPSGKTNGPYTIPNGVTTINDFAFYGCENLTSITIPDSVKTVGDYAFSGCVKLKTVYKTSSATWDYSFGSTTEVILYDYLITYLLENEEIIYEYILASQDAKLLTPPEGYVYQYLVNGNNWTGKNINNDTIVTVIEEDAVTITYVGDYIGEEVIAQNADAMLPEAPYGYTYTFTAAGKEWTGESITEDVTVKVTKTPIVYTITYVGDYTGESNAAYLTDATLPQAPYGYTYSFTVNGKKWTGKSITEDVTVTVTKTPILYTVTFEYEDGHIEEITVPYLSNAKLPEPPYGYIYSFTAYGKEWTGESITRDVTVTVTKTRRLFTVTYKYDDGYTDEEKAVYLSSVTLPEPPYGYTYSFAANGKEWTGESITEDVTVIVTKTPIIYTVTYEGDYTGESDAAYLTDVILPKAPYGYTYTFTVDGQEWAGKSITGDITVMVTKSPIIYTVTYKGDYVGTEKAAYLTSVVLPEPPENYIYTFTANGTSWTGESITKDVTVTVKKLCDLAELSVNNLEEMTVEGDIINGKYYDRIFIPQVTVSENAAYKLYSEYECINEGTAFSLKKGENVFYAKVVAESGREKIYALNINRDIPESLGKLTVVQTIGGSLTMQVETEIKGNPSFYLYYGITQDDMVSMSAKYFADTNTILASGLSEETEYYLKLVAVYDEIKIESSVVKETTGKTLSSDCYVIETLTPPGGKITHAAEESGIGEISDLAVTNKYESIEIDVRVSEEATWGLYRTETSNVEIDKIVSLNAGRTVTRYIKVTSEDKEHQRTYSITIYRQTKSDKPKITVSGNVATITAPNSADTIRYTIDTTNPTENNGILYTAPFEVEDGMVIKAIAKQQDKDEYSDIEIYKVSDSADIRIVPLEIFKDGNKYFYSLNVEALDAITGKAIIAFYDDKKLIDMVCEDITEQTEHYIESNVTLNETATKYKAFVWRGIESLNPLAEYIEGEIE